MSTPMIKSMTVKDFMTQELEGERWYVENLLAKGGKMLFYGDTGIGKSRWLFALSKALLEGAPEFMGFRIDQSVEHRVLYICADMPERDAIDLFQKCYPDTEAWWLGENFRIEFCENTIELTDTDTYAYFQDTIEVFAPTLIIVDSLKGVIDPTMISKPGVGKRFYDLWNTLVDTDVVSTIFSHHEKKEQAIGGFNAKPPSGKAMFSGSKDWADHVTAMLQIYEIKGKIFLAQHKMRGFRWPTKQLKQAKGSLLWEEDISEAEKKLRHMFYEGVDHSNIVAHVTDKTVWNGSSLSRATAYRRLNELSQRVLYEEGA